MEEFTSYQIRLMQKLKALVSINEENGCWEWKGQIANSGRGRMLIRDMESQSNKMVSAADASYLAFIGEIPDKHIVKTTCENRLCINPEHLELVDMNSL